jgi:hypothetical protein
MTGAAVFKPPDLSPPQTRPIRRWFWGQAVVLENWEALACWICCASAFSLLERDRLKAAGIQTKALSLITDIVNQEKIVAFVVRPGCCRNRRR